MAYPVAWGNVPGWNGRIGGNARPYFEQDYEQQGGRSAETEAPSNQNAKRGKGFLNMGLGRLEPEAAPAAGDD